MDRPPARRGAARGFAPTALAYAVALAAAAGTGLALRGFHPLLVVALADLVGTVVVFGFSVASNNSSLYDPYWSVAPPAIGAAYALLGPEVGAADRARILLVLVLVTAWGLRLTWSWARGWAGLGHEDWRYVEIRRRTGRLYWPASFLSIHLMPTTFVYLGCLSVHVAVGAGARPLSLLDGVAATVTSAAILVEATADRQLRRFVTSGPPAGAILESGLWAFSRHPNYFGEVLFWWGLWLFALAADPGRLWTVAGPLAITCLFVFISVPLMDRRMLARRSGFADRMRRVSALVPWPPRR
jgi:steroid 5-alpha reductase family enzyme